MPIELTEADKIGMSPEDIAMLTAADADDLLAKTGPDAAPEGDAGTAAAPGAEAGAEAQADDAGAGEAAAEPVAQAAPPAQPAPYNVPTTDFDAKRKELRGQLRSLEESWSSGADTMTDEAYTAKRDELQDQLDTVLIDATRASTLREANEQAAANAKLEIFMGSLLFDDLE